MSLPSPRFRLAPLPKELCEVRGFNSLQTFFPTLSKLYRLNKHQTDGVWFDSKWRIVGIDISGTSGPCSLKLVPNQDLSGDSSGGWQHNAYLKVTHLLDPVKWMKGKYSLPKQNGLPWHNKTWANAWTKLQDPWNQAYVEAVASYALGRLRDEGVSPHFNEFYGAFCARADLYRYNMTEEFGSFRNARWFWHGQKKGLYKLCVINTEAPEKSIDDDTLQEYLREPSVVNSDDDSSGSEQSVEEIESQDEIDVGEVAILEEVASIHSREMSEMSFAEESEEGSEESEMPDDSHKIYSELSDFPVMLIAIEKNSGTMDALLDNIDEIGAKHGTPEWELRWSAWLFQVIAGLTVAQAVFGFTHNDLHTNNIVWTPTKEEFMYYTLASGATFKVPTFGKLFRIIDFGRAIFSINGNQFISDDFRAGNDADGQYSFKPLHSRPSEEVPPNPSFDLSRLAVSLFESLFPDAPAEAEGGAILSSEDGLTISETVSPLFNCIWSWMIDDEGANVLINSDGSERFPDFDLYKHIAAYIHGAVPSQQLKHPAFDRFQVNPSEVGKVKKWQLFC
jgi:hypothetical protein